MDPEQAVQEFIDAVNANDLDRVVRCFAEDAVMKDEPGTVIAQGADAIRAHFGRFLPQSPNMHGTVLSRMSARGWVVQKEHCSGLILGEPIPEFDIVVAYRVENGKIAMSIGLQ